MWNVSWKIVRNINQTLKKNNAELIKQKKNENNLNLCVDF